MADKIVRRICTGCQNVYKETSVSEKYFDLLMDSPNVDYSCENGIDIVTKTGCCKNCENDVEGEQ